MISNYQAYKPYVQYLDSLIHDSQNQPKKLTNTAAINIAINGEASSKLREVTPLAQLRKDGAFFTGELLLQIVSSSTLGDINNESIYLDPACGIGNLLLACSKKLPLQKTLEDTLEYWDKRLIGRDPNIEFINAARARLALAAIERGARAKTNKKLPLSKILKNIKRGDGLSIKPSASNASHIIMNPPFTKVDAPDNCKWASGHVNAATIFLEDSVTKAKAGTRIIAILPDVLRSGSRYNKWRELISSNLNILNISTYGQFDNFADVDVFILDAIKTEDKSESTDKWWTSNSTTKQKVLGDMFDVHVGPVVPHRHPEVGPRLPYIHAKNLPAWHKINTISESRKFSGTTYTPPFVAIRRTSRPGDKYRATGTIITGKEPMAIENHVIICRPKSGLVRECNKLLKALKTEVVNEWLNERIRCRHLTVSAVKELSLPNKKE